MITLKQLHRKNSEVDDGIEHQHSQMLCGRRWFIDDLLIRYQFSKSPSSKAEDKAWAWFFASAKLKKKHSNVAK